MADKIQQWKVGDVISASKMNAMVDAINELEGSQGPQGPQGPQGEDGRTPVKGVDYFTEADKEEMLEGYATESFVQEEIAKAQLSGDGEVNLDAYATKEYVDGEIAKIEVGGEVGGETEVVISDIPPSTDTKIWIKAAEDTIVYPKIVLSSNLTYINERESYSIGVKLDNPPIEATQAVDIISVNNKLLLNTSKLIFSQSNYNQYQYVRIEYQIDDDTIDDMETVIFSTLNDNYVELTIQLIDEGEVDNHIYNELSSSESGYGFNSIEGTVKNIQILGRTTEGVGLLNAENTYTITICSSNGGTLSTGEKSKANCPNSTTVGNTVSISTGSDVATTKISRELLPPVIHIGSTTNAGNRIWLIDENDVILKFSSVWGTQSPKTVDVPNNVSYAVFAVQQRSSWNNDSCWTCWNAHGQYETYGLIDSVIDKIEFKIPHPLRSDASETVHDELKFNTSVNTWELITRIGEDGNVLETESTMFITTTTKSTLSAYDGMTRMYMMEYGTHPLIKCDIPVSMDGSVAMLSLDDPQPMTMMIAEETEYDNGIYIKTENGFIPLQLSAANTKINDIYGYFNSYTVEGALNELGTKVNNIDLSNVSFNDIQGTVPISKLPMESIKNDIGSNLEVTMISKLKGKNIICDGDSITYGSFVSFTDGVYATILRNQTGANVTNVAVPGDFFTDAISHLENSSVTSPDIITFLFGANDATTSVAAGDVANIESDSICKRVKDIIDYCNTTYPDAKVVFMTTMPRKGYLNVMEQYRTAIINTCRTYGAYCLDIHGQSGISLYTKELEGKWTNGDGCHYLQNAHSRIASLLINFLESII